MTHELKDVGKLQYYAKFENTEDVKNFEELVWNISDTNDPAKLPILLDLLDDNSNMPEIMFSIIHAIERYPIEIYIRVILKNLKSMLEKSPEWTTTIFCRIFNQSDYLNAFISHINEVDTDTITQLFDLISKEFPAHGLLLKELELRDRKR